MLGTQHFTDEINAVKHLVLNSDFLGEIDTLALERFVALSVALIVHN